MKYNLAILGATGAVGMEMINILAERNFPVDELRLLASSRSAGKKIDTPFGEITVIEATSNAFEGIDIVLGAAENDISVRFAEDIKKSGAIYIDNSSAFRMNDDVPLVVPEINPEDVKKHNGIIANPNCTTIITLVAINGIRKLSEIKGIYASSYQAVSGAGAGGPVEMYEQSKSILNGEKTVESKVFAHQIAFNLIPQIGGFGENGYSSEEMKLQNEGRKIMHLPNLTVSCTCVRVPVERSHSISANIITADRLELEDVENMIAKMPGCKLMMGDEYPMPIDTSNQDTVFVGRIRRDLVNENGINLFCCGDQVRKGAATNAVQIAELLIN
ncbi:MAG: aspartate-semialdehyde dehydrogenase [Eubacteriales bacterium]|nr:aspartate-semialdehyde dehydrogenase [Eubacteriales bacterium]MDY3333203.1 aspartate-semialdehyde dehydrogenase [Gallibacter sp.]